MDYVPKPTFILFHHFSFAPRTSFFLMDPSTSEEILFRLRELLREDSLGDFFNFVDRIFSEDKSFSDPASQVYEVAMDKCSNALSTQLCSAIQNSPNTETKMRCSTLFARFLVLKSPMLHQQYARLKTFFIQLLQEEEEWKVLKIHCTCVSRIAAEIFPKQDWPELLELMLEWLSSPNSTLTRLASIVLLFKLIPECPDTFSPHVDTISSEFQRLMDDGCEDNTARIATVGAAAKFILHLATPSNYVQYYGLLRGMISVLGGAVYDLDLACKALDAMTILAKEKPRFFTLVHMAQLAEAMLKMAITNSNENMRQLAVNFFIAVGEGGDEGKGTIQSLPLNVIKGLLTQLLQMLMCVEDDDVEDDDVEDVSDSDEGKMTMCHYADESLSRLAIVLGGDVVGPNSPDLLPVFFEDDDWKKRYAAVLSLGLIASGCSKVTESQHLLLLRLDSLHGSLLVSFLNQMLVQYLESSVKKTMALVFDHQPHVRWAAIYAISEFSKHLSPYFQEQCHEEVIPALLKCMDDFRDPRVQVIVISLSLNLLF